MERLPLNILIGPKDEAVLIENELVAGLMRFELNTSKHVKTAFVCSNCFPRPSGHRINQPDKYPLRIYVGDDVNQVLLTYEGRPVGHFCSLYIMLSASDKRIIRVISLAPLPEELNTALLDLGVEVIVQSPDAQVDGDADACL